MIVLNACTAEQARALTDRIKVAVEATWDLVKQAYEGRAWEVLGYSSWDDYCTREFGTCRLRLPREERQEVVASLRESGLSIRAIESATGISRPTVIKDLRAAEVVNTSPPAPIVEPDPVDGGFIAYADETPGAVGQGDTEDEAVADLAEATAAIAEPPPPTPKPITGIDGKTYQRPASKPTTPRRAPLGDAIDKAGWELRRAVERLQRLTEDDRYSATKPQVAAHLGSHLTNAIEVCQDLLDGLTPAPQEDR